MIYNYRLEVPTLLITLKMLLKYNNYLQYF